MKSASNTPLFTSRGRLSAVGRRRQQQRNRDRSAIPGRAVAARRWSRGPCRAVAVHRGLLRQVARQVLQDLAFFVVTGPNRDELAIPQIELGGDLPDHGLLLARNGIVRSRDREQAVQQLLALRRCRHGLELTRDKEVLGATEEAR